MAWMLRRFFFAKPISKVWVDCMLIVHRYLKVFQEAMEVLLIYSYVQAWIALHVFSPAVVLVAHSFSDIIVEFVHTHVRTYVSMHHCKHMVAWHWRIIRRLVGRCWANVLFPTSVPVASSSLLGEHLAISPTCEVGVAGLSPRRTNCKRARNGLGMPLHDFTAKP